jgi:transcriptional regulator with XRE-family HTH domain
MDIYMDFEMLKDVLKAARTKLNLKQSEVAELIGITTQTYLKWENGHSEPKASQVGKLAKVLKVSEREICQGQIHETKLEPLEFVRRVGILMNEVPHTELLIGMHEYINDSEGFINMLAKVSDYPYELLEIENKESEIFNARLLLDVVGVEPKQGETEQNVKAREHALGVLNKGR